MTGFYLSVGYDCFGKTAFEAIRDVANGITSEALKAKALEYGCPEADGAGTPIDEYIAKGLTYETSRDGSMLEWYIAQYASGGGAMGGTSRQMKEAIRRAFGMLVLDECYKRGLSVSFEIK